MSSCMCACMSVLICACLYLLLVHLCGRRSIPWLVPGFCRASFCALCSKRRSAKTLSHRPTFLKKIKIIWSKHNCISIHRWEATKEVLFSTHADTCLKWSARDLYDYTVSCFWCVIFLRIGVVFSKPFFPHIRCFASSCIGKKSAFIACAFVDKTISLPRVSEGVMFPNRHSGSSWTVRCWRCSVTRRNKAVGKFLSNSFQLFKQTFLKHAVCFEHQRSSHTTRRSVVEDRLQRAGAGTTLAHFCFFHPGFLFSLLFTFDLRKCFSTPVGCK